MFSVSLSKHRRSHREIGTPGMFAEGNDGERWPGCATLGASPPRLRREGMEGASGEGGMLRDHHANSDWRAGDFLGKRGSGYTRQNSTQSSSQANSFWTKVAGVGPEHWPLGKTRPPSGQECRSCWPTGGASCLSLREGPAATQASGAQPSPPPGLCSFGTPTPRLPTGGKAVTTAPVPGQTPHDESDRRTEPRSSVSDLVNSLTSEMLMVSRQWGGRGRGRDTRGNW